MTDYPTDRTAAQVANDFNRRWYGVPAPDLSEVRPCERRQCRGRIRHSRVVHWFGWVRR